MAIAPSASYSLTARLQIPNRPGMLGRVASAIGEAGGDINLEDIAAPRCFEIEDRLRKDLKRLRVVVTGVGAAGTATIKILQASGVRDIIGVDEHGTIHRGRAKGMDFMKQWVASATNPRHVKGRLSDAVAGADVFIGLSVPGILTVRDVKRVNDEMKLAAARALAACVGRSELGAEYIIPSVFNKAVAPAVAAGVARAAHETGVARRRRRMSVAGLQ